MSTILTALADQLSAKLISASDFAPALASGHPLSFEDQAFRVISTAVEQHKYVVVDDLHLILKPALHHFGPRSGLIEVHLIALCNKVLDLGHKIILGADCCLPHSVEQRGFGFGIPRFTIEDYRYLLNRWIPDSGLDVERIHRFAPKLDAHHLHAVAEWWRHHSPQTTDGFIEVLRAQRLGSNVDLGEVQNVRMEDLVGVEDAVATLARTIVLPYEDETLAEELGLRAKRGVLLYGPPGTGKTTVGRALAHRLKGKFFLIDGTFIAGSQDFYQRVHQVFEAAKENSPSVIFIDDADAIFENRTEQGLYRYLLTMIDGLESESNSRVTVMMTAMNLGDLPSALVRSGRIELWLEMRLPDAAARRKLLEREACALPVDLHTPLGDSIINATDGLTGADLKAALTDARSLFAVDRKAGKPNRGLEAYLSDAVNMIRANREKHAQALAMAQMRQQVVAQQGMVGHWQHAAPPDEED